MSEFHKPVLLKETLAFLSVQPGGRYLDATLGDAGHTLAILAEGGQVLGLDQDPAAVAFSRKRLVFACPPSAFSWKLVQGNFAHLKRIVKENGFSPLSGILFDLGVSTRQIKESGKGLSFAQDEPLDMRLSPELAITAAELINRLGQKQLMALFADFGEEPQAAKIARELVAARQRKPFTTSLELAKFIFKIKGRSRSAKIHPATQVFQALRIAVNGELANLELALPQALDCLAPGGRLAVISFHSLEDGLVKRFFQAESQANRLKELTVKPVSPGPEEIKNNPSSRSARLRACEKNNELPKK